MTKVVLFQASVYLRSINATSCLGSQSVVPNSTDLCRNRDRRLQVESSDEIHCGFFFVGSYDSRRASEAEFDEPMEHAVFPSLVLDFWLCLDGGTVCGMSLLSSILPSSPGRFILLYYPAIVFQEY
jgi:hypothetical protein